MLLLWLVLLPVTGLSGLQVAWRGLIVEQALLTHAHRTTCWVYQALGRRRLSRWPNGLQVEAYARETKLPDGRRLIDEGWVQTNLAKVYAGVEYLRLLNWKVAWTASEGTLSPADASAVKVYGTEFYLDALRTLTEVMGPRGYLARGSKGAVAMGTLEGYYRSLLILTFGGGTNEIQRDLIGLFGLGLPRVPRH